MRSAAFITGLLFICCHVTHKTRTEAQLEEVVQSECRDRYLWIQVASERAARFEAVDENGIHSISEQLASRCGYTISSFRADGFTTFRASYYSCFTHNQNDQVFTFRINVMVTDASGRWISWPVSAACSGLTWTHREVICEEDYVEVNVNRESSCGGLQGDSGLVWQAAFSQVRSSTSVWQLMIIEPDGHFLSMSIAEAQKRGYSLTTSAQRVVLRSRYQQPQAKLTVVGGVPMEVVQASLFFKQKLTVVMIDLTMACTINPGSFDGTWLLWNVPRVVTPLVTEGVTFESQSLSLGVDGVLLDESTSTARGYSVVPEEHLIQIGIPFGAEGGYRKSLVVDNVYKETYEIFLMYEHVFSLLYDDGSSIDTRHRMFRVLNTPPLCRAPVSLDQTRIDEQVFRVYLGNIPADVQLEEVRINKEQLVTSGSIHPVIHSNGSQAYELQLPFDSPIVHSVYLGHGVLQYSIDVNFTLTIMPQRDSYYHHTFITARVLNAFPPEITAQCSDRAITFSTVASPRVQSLWEVGVDHEPLTSQLASQRGYLLYNDTHRTTLEVPVFSVGYDYEGINLSSFYGTFNLLLRDSKTLEVQTSTSKRCLFKTQDMIVCSSNGVMTVVTTVTSTWPTVQPEETTLLDPTCGPKQTDGTRVLFEFKLDSCGTRAMAGESYVVYENELLHNRRMIADGPNFISRDSQFKLTVRCFYPLSGLNRVSVDRIFGSSGFGSFEVFKNVQADPVNEVKAPDCSRQVHGSAASTPGDHTSNILKLSTDMEPHPQPGPIHPITASAGNNWFYLPQNLPSFPHLDHSSATEDPNIGTHHVSQLSSHSDHPMSQTQEVYRPPAGKYLPSRHLVPHHVQPSNPNFVGVGSKSSGMTEVNTALSTNTGSRSPGSPGVEQVDSGGSSPALRFQGSDRLSGVWHSGPIWEQLTPGPSTNTSPGMNEPPQQHESRYDSSLTAQLQPAAWYSPDHRGISGQAPTGQSAQESVGTQQVSPVNSQAHTNLERPGSLERRNTEMVQFSVKNIRVKPLSRFMSFGHLQKQVLQQADPEISFPDHCGPDLTAVNSDGSPQTSQQFPEPRGPKLGHRCEAPGVLMLKKQSVHRIQPGPHQPTANHFTNLDPNQQDYQKLVKSFREHSQRRGQMAPEGTEPGQKPSSVLWTPGRSRLRVRPVPGLSAKLQNLGETKEQILQNPTPPSDKAGGTSSPSLTPRSNGEPPVSIRAQHTNNPYSAGGTGFAGVHTGPSGSDVSGSDLLVRPSGCSSPYGASVHQGIIRGTEVSMS